MLGKKNDNNFGLKVVKIYKSYFSKGKKLSILENISFIVPKGTITSIVGNSGCGKTTLLNIIGDIIATDSGSVSFHGSIGYVPQKDLLLSWRNILENILLPVEIKKSYNKEIVNSAKKLLKDNSLEKFAKHFPKEISGGMRQKVSLIRNYIQNPDIVLCDEPFSAIDFSSRLKLVKQFRSHIIANKKCALFVTHNIEEAIAVGDSVIVLGSKPTKIVYQSSVNIPEIDRDPITIRKNISYEKIFEDIWKAMAL